MQSRALVIDANILLRAVMGQRVRALIHDYAASVNFYAAELNVLEAERYIENLAHKRGLSMDVCEHVLEATLSALQIFTTETISDFKDLALERIQEKDPNDWPALAIALKLDCPIWTEDKDFFGSGVAVWTTETVEIYLRNDNQ
jgi:predicted nucleic acid-binding protein